MLKFVSGSPLCHVCADFCEFFLDKDFYEFDCQFLLYNKARIYDVQRNKKVK